MELAAELHRTTREVVAYGLDRIDPDKDIKVSVIEAAERVLPALPERLSKATEELLTDLGVSVHTSARVAEISGMRGRGASMRWIQIRASLAAERTVYTYSKRARPSGPALRW